MSERLRSALKRTHRSSGAPGFDDVWAQAKAQSRRQLGWRALMVAAVLTTALLLAWVWPPLSRPIQAKTGLPTSAPLIVPPIVLALSDWQAPTDFLLETPGSELMAALPVVGELPELPTAYLE